MITLYTFGRRLGLPDASPFVTKAETLLRMSGLPYRADTGGYRKAPKGKLPFIDDGGTIVADSTFIRRHLETRHGIDFDKGVTGGLTERDKAIGWAFEKMCEEHLAWAMVDARWLDDRNWAVTKSFFDFAPKPLIPVIGFLARRNVRAAMKAQGFGRHSHAEIEALAARDLDAISTFLADKPYFFGPEPSGTDATIWAFLAGTLCDWYETPIRRHAESRSNLVAYRDRLMKQYFPDLAAG